MRKMVWVEIDAAGWPIRILKNQKEVFRPSALIFAEWLHTDAVYSIRRLLFGRCRGDCEICNSPLTFFTGHMHERHHRGKGGEISLANSIFICANCHRRAHKERNPQFTKGQS